MRPSLQLLPYRLRQAVLGRPFRAAFIRFYRALTKPASGTPADMRRLYVDLAVISQHDAGTGIQRVVRELALALLDEGSARWDIRFVSAHRDTPYHRIGWPVSGSEAPSALPTGRDIMRARHGDVFLGLDYSLDAVRWHRRQLARFRRDGGTMWFLVHDVLPLRCPDWFSENTVVRYKAWLGMLACFADGFLCNSPQTEAELREALAEVYGLASGYRTQVLPMGHVVPQGEAGGDAVWRFDPSAPFALMVGTLEPRKGHAEIVGAFDALWREGGEQRLVLVGRLGWQVEGLRDHIRNHPEHGRKLFWFDDVDDAELFRIYEACTGVIVASYGEGFGLPLIEALGHGKPVLARDLPVFRLHQDKGVRYFPANPRLGPLASLVREWLDQAGQGGIVVTRPTDGWRDSARMLLAAVA